MTPSHLVVFSHLRYDGVRQRPQHLLTRFAARLPTLVVEEPLAGDDDREERSERDGLTVLRPIRRAPADAIDGRTLAAVRAWLGAEARPAAWFYAPMMVAALDAVPWTRVVFDSMDDLAAFRFAPPELAEREAGLLARADVVFTGGRSLHERLRDRAPLVVCLPSGVDVAHFARALGEIAPDPLTTSLAGPVFGYVGVIDERVDLGIVASLAEVGDVLLVGPLAKIDPAQLPGGRRVHYAGLVPYARLPALLAGLDVATMPFVLDDATRRISPTKTPEYLAAGLPVISTAIPDVVAAYGDVVATADPDAFAGAALVLAREPDPERVAAGAAAAARASWDAIARTMWGYLTASA